MGAGAVLLAKGGTQAAATPTGLFWPTPGVSVANAATK
jgi:hypothetical protein